MIRRLMASSAVLALISAGAFTVSAADNKTAKPAVVLDDSVGASATLEASTIEAEKKASEAAVSGEEVLTPEQPTLASVFIGRSVFSSIDPESDNIGDVNDLIVSEDGTITHAVVGVGGFLGIGEKDVAVPFDELEVVEKDGDIRLIYASTREQLEAAPALDRTAFDPIARFAEEQAASVDSGTGLAPATPPAEDMTAAPAEEPTIVAEEPAIVEEETADATATAPAEEPAEEMAAAPAEEPAVAEEETADATATAPAEEPAEEMAAAPAEEPALTAEEETADATATAPAEEPVEEMAAAEEPVIVEEETADAMATAPAEEELAAAEEPAPAATGEIVFLSFSPDQIQASDMIGQAVYGPEDESIGEISDLVLEEGGDTRAALIDVGGFLGVGEKTVAIPFTEIQISASEDGSGQRLAVAMTREQLEQLPAIEPVDEESAAIEEPALAPDPAAPAPAEGEIATTEAPALPADEEIVTGAVDSTAGIYEPAEQNLSADQLMGSTVYGPDDSTLGEVSDVVFAETGEIEGVVVDVGGFLGFGEKPVAVGFDSIQVQTDSGGSLLVMVSATNEQLEGAPTYEEEAPAEATVQ